MPTRMKSAERRDAIVQCAIHLFAERGFRGTTTRELAAAVGVTEPVLYQHFRTKRDLYNAIIEAKSAEAGARAAGLKELAAKSDDRAFFGAVGDAILARYRDDPEIPRLMLFSCLERHELAGLFFERLSLGLHQLATSYIRRRIREGAFRKVNPEIAARALIGVVSQHALAALLLPEKIAPPDRRVVAQGVEIFLEGIAARPASE